METVIHLNKTAIGHLVQGMFGSAVASLQDALSRQLKLQLEAAKGEETQNISPPCLGKVLFVDLPTSSLDENQAFSMFGRALFVNPPQSESAERAVSGFSSVDRDIVSFVRKLEL